MPRVSAAVVGSIAAHAIALCVLQVVAKADRDAVPVPPKVAIELVPPAAAKMGEAEPIAIEFVTLPAVATAAPVAPAPGRSTVTAGRQHKARSGKPTAAVAAHESSGTPPEATPPEVTPPTPPTSLPEPTPTGGLSEEFIENFLAHSKPLEEPDDIPGERIGNEIEAAEHALASATTADEVMQARARLVALREQKHAEELHPAGGGSYEANEGPFSAHVNPDGTVDLSDAKNLQIHGLGGSFDLTDWAMRSHGDDPYTARKLAFLDRTRDQRVAIGKRYRKQQLAHSAQLAQRNLQRMLAKLPSIADRKQALFELWDECAETGDDDLVAGGAAARTMIIGVIRAELSGDNAYTAAELARFNKAKTSAATFAPYDDD